MNPSKNESHSFPTTLSKMATINGIQKYFIFVILLSFLKSWHIHNLPFFFSITTIGEIHSM